MCLAHSVRPRYTRGQERQGAEARDNRASSIFHPAEFGPPGEIRACQPLKKNSKWPLGPHWQQNGGNGRSRASRVLQNKWKNQCLKSNSKTSRKQNARG